MTDLELLTRLREPFADLLAFWENELSSIEPEQCAKYNALLNELDAAIEEKDSSLLQRTVK